MSARDVPVPATGSPWAEARSQPQGAASHASAGKAPETQQQATRSPSIPCPGCALMWRHVCPSPPLPTARAESHGDTHAVTGRAGRQTDRQTRGKSHPDSQKRPSISRIPHADPQSDGHTQVARAQVGTLPIYEHLERLAACHELLGQTQGHTPSSSDRLSWVGDDRNHALKKVTR